MIHPIVAKRKIKNQKRTNIAIRNLNKIKVDRAGLDQNVDRDIERIPEIEELHEIKSTEDVIIPDPAKKSIVNSNNKR